MRCQKKFPIASAPQPKSTTWSQSNNMQDTSNPGKLNSGHTNTSCSRRDLKTSLSLTLCFRHKASAPVFM